MLDCGVCGLKRHKMDMTFDVLQAIQQNSSILKISHLMCKTNIKGDSLHKTLSILLKNGLIEETQLLRRDMHQALVPLKTAHPRISWKTTEKGRRLIAEAD
jgi:predicted transcriptional regulator